MPLAPLSRRRKVNLSTVLGELVQTTDGKWITRPPTRCPQRTHSRPESSPRRSRRLPRTRPGRAHELALQNLRRDGVRAADEYPLHGTRRAGGRSHLNQDDFRVGCEKGCPRPRTPLGGCRVDLFRQPLGQGAGSHMAKHGPSGTRGGLGPSQMLSRGAPSLTTVVPSTLPCPRATIQNVWQML